VTVSVTHPFRLGCDIVSPDIQDKLRLNFVFDCSDVVINADVWKRMDKVRSTSSVI
jgi:hypothetical protein